VKKANQGTSHGLRSVTGSIEPSLGQQTDIAALSAGCDEDYRFPGSIRARIEVPRLGRPSLGSPQGVEELAYWLPVSDRRLATFPWIGKSGGESMAHALTVH